MGLHLHSGYSFALTNTLYAKPFLDGHAIRITDDAFTEEGTSPFRLAVDGRTDTAWLGATGVEFGAHQFPLSRLFGLTRDIASESIVLIIKAR